MTPPASPSSRREFLSRSGAAVAGLAIGACASGGASAAPAPLPAGRKVRLGVVGGNFGCGFFFHEHPDCAVAAVSDLLPERRDRLVQTYKCGTTHESLEKLILDKDLDAVAIFTGAPDHARHVLAALRAGKHVLCAVPAAMTLEECAEIVETVKRTGLTYMMAETSWYHQAALSARKFCEAGEFGTIYYTEAEYHHAMSEAGLKALAYDAQGRPTWRYGFPPMHYPTHCTAFVVGITGERLTEATCIGWGDDSPILKDNAYRNPFSTGVALFKTSGGHACRVSVFWRGAHRGCERAQWYGTKMSFFANHPNGMPACLVRAADRSEKDAGGFLRQKPDFEKVDVPNWWETDLLPAPLRHDSGHEGSHTFLTHEFIDAIAKGRRPAIDVYAAVAMTAPGIVAHQSALKGGAQMKVPSFDPA